MLRAFSLSCQLAALLIPVAAGHARAQAPGVATQEEDGTQLIERIDAYVAPFLAAQHLSGTLLVARGSEVLYERSWGLADMDGQAEFEASTASCVGSVTKPTTVLLTASLLQAGRLSLDDPLSKWLENFPEGERIEVQHLLNHRSGIPHDLVGGGDPTIARTPAGMVELARNLELDFEPGSREAYSSGGYTVLARVLELASGRSYEQLLEDTVLGPLGLSNTFHPGPGVDLRGAAKCYVWTANGSALAAAEHYSSLVGAGALFSTPRDMLQIARALIDGVFGARVRDQLLHGGKLDWNGITSTYRAFLDYDAATDVTVSFVSNRMVGANDLLRRDIPRIVEGEEVLAPIVPRPETVNLTAAQLQKFTGEYEVAGTRKPVRSRDGALFVEEWVLLPTSETSFFSPQDYRTVTVLLDEHNKPTSLDWGGWNCPRLGALRD